MVFGGSVPYFNSSTLPSIGNETRLGRINPNSIAMAVYVNGNPEVVTKAKLEMIEADERMLAQLTSYGPDNKLVIMYQFYVRPTTREFYKYHLQAKSVLVNETIKKSGPL